MLISDVGCERCLWKTPSESVRLSESGQSPTIATVPCALIRELRVRKWKRPPELGVDLKREGDTEIAARQIEDETLLTQSLE